MLRQGLLLLDHHLFPLHQLLGSRANRLRRHGRRSRLTHGGNGRTGGRVNHRSRWNYLLRGRLRLCWSHRSRVHRVRHGKGVRSRLGKELHLGVSLWRGRGIHLLLLLKGKLLQPCGHRGVKTHGWSGWNLLGGRLLLAGVDNRKRWQHKSSSKVTDLFPKV